MTIMERQGRKRKIWKNFAKERIERKRKKIFHRQVVIDSGDSDIKKSDQEIDEDNSKNKDDMTNENSEGSIDAADVSDKTSIDKDKGETERNTNPNCVIKQKTMDIYFRKRTMAASGEHMYSPIVITENDTSLDIDQDGIEMVHFPYQPPEVVNLESGDESNHESEGISVKPEPLDESADQATDIQDDKSCHTAVNLREEAVPSATHILNTGSDNMQQEQTAAITREKDDDKIPVTEIGTDNNNDSNDSSKEIDINEMGAVNIENSGTVAGVDSDNDLDCVLIKENEELMKGAQTEAGHEIAKPADAKVGLDFRKRTMAASGEHMYSPIVITENDTSLDIDQDGIEMMHFPYQPPEVVNLESGDENDHESEGNSVKPEPLDGSADQATNIQDDNSCHTAVDLREEAVPIATHILNTGSDNIQQEQTAAITTEKDDDKIPVTEVETDNNNDCNDSSKEIDINEMGAVNIENSGTVAGVDSDNDLDCVLIKENEELMKGAQTEAGHETVKPTDARVDLDFRKRTMAASGEHMYSPIVIAENDTSLDIDQDGIEMMHFPYQPPEVVNLESGDENDHESEGISVKPGPLDGSADQATDIQDDDCCNTAVDLREEAFPNASHTLNTSSDVQQEQTAAITREKEDERIPVIEVETDNNDCNNSRKTIDINEMDAVDLDISGTVVFMDSDNDLDCVIIEENEELKKGAQLKAGHEIVKQTDVRGGLELHTIDKERVKNGTEFERSNENENIGSEEQGRDEVVSKDKEGMVKRPTSCTESIFKCDHCEVRCNDEKSMREHLDTAVHYAASKYIVDNTGGLKLMKNVVITNMKAKFKTTVMKCPVAACPAIFPQMNQCVDHYNKKHWKKGRPKSLYGLTDIVKEEECSIALKEPKCCQCAEPFETLDNLKRHMIKKGHFPFDLTEHRVIFLCLYCGKYFKCFNGLICHQRVHLDVIDVNYRILLYDKFLRTFCIPTTSRSHLDGSLQNPSRKRDHNQAFSDNESIIKPTRAND